MDENLLHDVANSDHALIGAFAQHFDHWWHQRVFAIIGLLSRALAQLGSAFDWGSKGRGFKSRMPD
jgi:hypothetical protein